MLEDARLPRRFWAKVEPDPATGCWMWTGTPTTAPPAAYAQFRPGGSRPKVYAHRHAYATLVGPVPDGLQLDHLCRRTLCVNPTHLEPVTARVNKRRATEIIEQCRRGHPLAAGNVYRDGRGWRSCRTCRRNSTARWRISNTAVRL